MRLYEPVGIQNIWNEMYTLPITADHTIVNFNNWGGAKFYFDYYS